MPDLVSVRSRRWKQTGHRLLEGRDLEKQGQGEELSIQNARHHDHKKETGGEMPSSESSASTSDSYVKETEGHRSADAIRYHSYSLNGRRNK